MDYQLLIIRVGFPKTSEGLSQYIEILWKGDVIYLS